MAGHGQRRSQQAMPGHAMPCQARPGQAMPVLLLKLQAESCHHISPLPKCWGSVGLHRGSTAERRRGETFSLCTDSCGGMWLKAWKTGMLTVKLKTRRIQMFASYIIPPRLSWVRFSFSKIAARNTSDWVKIKRVVLLCAVQHTA